MLKFSNLSFFIIFIISIAVFICGISSASYGQSNTGKITGIVVDAETGEAVVGANVAVEGSTSGAATDIDGKFSIRADPGTFNITISYISYAKKVITDVSVAPGETTSLDISMEPKTVGLEEVTVTAGALSNSEAGLLAMQRKAVSFQDGIFFRVFE